MTTTHAPWLYSDWFHKLLGFILFSFRIRTQHNGTFRYSAQSRSLARVENVLHRPANGQRRVYIA